MPKGVTEGRIVHFVLPDGQHRAAMIVRVWTPNTVNVTVFPDGYNDIDFVQSSPNFGVPTVWKTSIPYSEAGEPGTWHFPEKVD